MPPFDIPAAKITAGLMRDTDLIKSIKKEEKIQHQCIKTDAMILAIAIHGTEREIAPISSTRAAPPRTGVPCPAEWARTRAPLGTRLIARRKVGT